jgi:cytochrome c553
MNDRRAAARIRRTLSFAFLAALPQSGSVTAQELPKGDGREAVLKVCGGCHEAAIVAGKKLTKPEWADLVDQMLEKGANATEKEVQSIVDYLSKYFGREDKKIS